MTTIPALSVRQPWAHTILHLGKDIENRSWAWDYRGPLVIHASKNGSRQDYESAVQWIARNVDQRIADRVPPLGELPRGGIVGMVDMFGTTELAATFSRWADRESGCFWFWLLNPRVLPFVPFKGKVGKFHVPCELVELRPQA